MKWDPLKELESRKLPTFFGFAVHVGLLEQTVPDHGEVAAGGAAHGSPRVERVVRRRAEVQDEQGDLLGREGCFFDCCKAVRQLVACPPP